MTSAGVKRTVELSSNIGRGCDHCSELVGFSSDDGVAGSINHYISEHGYRLLHVGSQTIHGSDGKPWHTTVAVLGHDSPPALKEPVQVTVGFKF
jgi:hypothetical protein